MLGSRKLPRGFIEPAKKSWALMARNKLIVMLNMLEMLSLCHADDRKSA